MNTDQNLEPSDAELAERLRDLIHRCRWKLSEAAEKMGVSESYVSHLQNGNRPFSPLRRERLLELERIHRVVRSQDTELKEESADFDAGYPRPRFIPVVSWTHAGDAVAYEELPLDQRERVATFCADPKAFAVTVEGDSMLPDFKPGDRVIMAPSREPRNGRPVVAKLADDGVVLRIFHRLRNDTIRLSSLRPDVYPSIDYSPAEFQWVWPVEELSRKI